MFIAVDGLNRDRADGGREAIFVQPGSQERTLGTGLIFVDESTIDFPIFQ